MNHQIPVANIADEIETVQDFFLLLNNPHLPPLHLAEEDNPGDRTFIHTLEDPTSY